MRRGFGPHLQDGVHLLLLDGRPPSINGASSLCAPWVSGHFHAKGALELLQWSLIWLEEVGIVNITEFIYIDRDYNEYWATKYGQANVMYISNCCI